MDIHRILTINNIIIQWMYLPTPGVSPSVTLPQTYTTSTSWACSAIIHNPSTTAYTPTTHLYTKNNSSFQLSIRYNGGGYGQTAYVIAIGY